MSKIFNFPQQQYGVNLQAKKRLEPVRCRSSFISVSAVLQVSLLCWVSLALGCLGCCCCWSFSVPVLHGRKVYIYISLSLSPSLAPSFPPSSSAPPSPYVYIICWSSLRNRNAHGFLCFGSTMWEYTGASSNSSADHFSMIISACRNYHQGAKIQVRVPVTGRPFSMIKRACRIYVEGVVTRSTVSDAGVGGSGSGRKRPFKKPVLGCATMATAAVPPAELAMVSTRRVRGSSS